MGWQGSLKRPEARAGATTDERQPAGGMSWNDLPVPALDRNENARVEFSPGRPLTW
jgi:hypothetical protein